MERKIVNLTQHNATPEQRVDGVIDLCPKSKKIVKELLTFDTPPLRVEMAARAKKVAELARGWEYAMIGGAPFFMSFLEKELINLEKTPVYSFSTRKSKEEVVDGKVVKTSVFVHSGFVYV